jgi:LPXTG-site transpeptidase (sortase) family protein
MKRKLLKYFLLFFLLSFLILNWGRVSFIFNWQVISQFLKTPFEKKIEKEISQPEEKKFEYSEKENSIEILKIEISAPIVFVKSEKEIEMGLDKGVVLFPGSALPGQIGKTIIEGHSAPPGWPKIKYDWIFSRLNELEEGDEVNLNFNHQKLNYYVTKKIFLNRGEEIPFNDLTNSDNSDNILLLISCWPPGKDLKRIAVAAILKK